MVANEFFADSTTNSRWSDEEFLARRSTVLARWPTGSMIDDLPSCVDHVRSLPETRSLPMAVRRARQQGVPLFQVGIGHTTLEDQQQHMVRAAESGVDLIMVATDTYTRKSAYERAQAGIEQAKTGTEKRVLNGFPIVNYGLEAREVFSSAGVPVHISGNIDEEAMLSTEFGFASGATCDYSHSLHDLVQHSREYPLRKRMQTDQYVSRLAAHYTANGAPIELVALANYQGLMPPGLGIAVAVLSVLTSAEQGARFISLERGIEGCLVQDVAAFQAYRRVADYYVKQHAYDVDLVTHSWPWMGAWPAPEHENAGLVSWCTSISILAGVDWIYLKSVHEGSGIPDIESNVASIEMAKQLRRVVAPQGMLTSQEIDEESHFIELEARSIIDAVLDVGDGDVCIGQEQAVAGGYLDIPIASWNQVADRLVVGRDADGAVRYIDSGNLPLPPEVRARHSAKIAQRKRGTSGSAMNDDIALVIRDIRQYMSG